VLELAGVSVGPEAAGVVLAAEPVSAAGVAASVAEVAIAIVKAIGAVVAAIATALAAIYGVITLGDAVIEKIGAALNETDDDRARERIFGSSPEQIRGIELNELVSMIFAMLDGPTGDDDERAILKVLESFDCAGRIRIVDRVGADNLMDNLDGDEGTGSCPCWPSAASSTSTSSTTTARASSSTRTPVPSLGRCRWPRCGSSSSTCSPARAAMTTSAPS
jgi:hypothetical protein